MELRRRGLAGRVRAAFEETPGRGPPLPLLLLGLAIALIPAVRALQDSFRSELIVQDDARMFMTWMRSWQDPALFDGDLIAEYFRSVTPEGFSLLYWVLFQLGLDPFVAGKLLPIPLGLLMAWVSARLAFRILPVPAAALLGAISTSLVWLEDDLASATPRSFGPPALVGAMLAFASGRTLTGAGVLAAAAFLYPTTAVFGAGVMCFTALEWRDGRLGFVSDKKRVKELLIGLLLIGAALLPFASSSSDFGPATTREQAQAMPTFFLGARAEFFLDDPLIFWICARRSGFLPVEWGCGTGYERNLDAAPAIGIVLLVLTFAIPIGLALAARRPGPARPRSGALLFAGVLVVSLVLFAAAHALLFRLHLPARYAQSPLRAVAPSVLAVLLAFLLARLFARTTEGSSGELALSLGVCAALVTAPIVVATTHALPLTSNVEGRHPGLYAALRAQPPKAVVASLALEADMVPPLGMRTTLVAYEYSLAYSSRYHAEILERIAEIAGAIFATEPGPIQDIVTKRGVTHFLIQKDGFSPEYVMNSWWATERPDAAKAARAVAHSEKAILPKVAAVCEIWSDGVLRLIDARCVLEQLGAKR